MPDTPTNDDLLTLAAEVLDIESRAVETLKSRLNDNFIAACDLCMTTPGRVVVTGMGKSGHVSKMGILGIYTDGDLRRTLDMGADIRTTVIRDVMHADCKTVAEDVLAAEALHMLEENKITSLLVADDGNKLIGALNIHDLFREGLM